MKLPSVPGPTELRAVVDQVVGLLPRAARVLADVERLVADARVTLQRIEGTRRDAEAIVVAVADTELRAAAALAAVDGLVVRSTSLLDRYEPTLTGLGPTLDRIAAVVEPRMVDAGARLVDELASVAPDLRRLLEASTELNEMLGKLPGMGRIKKRIEEEQETD
jgi:hypothetical protein